MKKYIYPKNWLIAYLIVFVIYVCISIASIAVMIYSVAVNNKDLLLPFGIFSAFMVLCMAVLLFFNRRVYWVWIENGVLKRKWLLFGKTQNIPYAWVTHITIFHDNNIYISFKRLNCHAYKGEKSVVIPNKDDNLKMVRTFWNGDIYTYELCDSCKTIKEVKRFESSEEYLKTLAYLKEISDSEDYELLESEYPLDAVRDENGAWVDDMILHTIKCKKCSSLISCFCDTYHGNGNLTITPMPHLLEPNT